MINNLKTYTEGNLVIDQYGKVVKTCDDEIEAKDFCYRMNGYDGIDSCDDGYYTDSFGYNYSDWN